MEETLPTGPTARTDQEQAKRGIFLPSMEWTADPQEVQREKQRLLVIQERFASLVASAQRSDDCATWYLMAEASLSQLDRDLDGLYGWLEASERQRLIDTGSD